MRIGLALPVPVSMRVDDIVAQLRDAGIRATRKDLFLAAVLALPAETPALVELLQRYRTATVGDMLPSARGSTVVLRRPGPGPRPANEHLGSPLAIPLRVDGPIVAIQDRRIRVKRLFSVGWRRTRRCSCGPPAWERQAIFVTCG